VVLSLDKKTRQKIGRIESLGKEERKKKALFKNHRKATKQRVKEGLSAEVGLL